MWVILFPGQGTQTIGMGKFYYNNFPLAKQLFEQASEELKIDFKKLCFEGPESQLMLTQNTQPAIVLVSCVAYFCLSQKIDLNFIKYMAGHSVGEYSALVCAGVLSLTQALKTVQQRGLYIHHSDPLGTGSMSALLGASPQEAKDFCLWVQKESGFTPLEIANLNSPTQTILSGSVFALKWAQKNYFKYNFTSKKIKLIALKVSAAFHSSMMAPACQKMKPLLKTLVFKKPNKIIIQNTVAKPITNIINLQKNFITQIEKPVLWQASMEYLFKQNCNYFLELGEGKVLSGLMKKIDNSKKVFHFNSLKDIQILKDFIKNEH